jgi:APA family basic amino acid/polyamine antiporter
MPQSPPSDAADTQGASLVRELGFFSAYCFVAGSVIGSGVFLVAADIAATGKERSVLLAEPFWALSVWLVAGVISLVGGLLFAELGCAFPKAGGQYVYLRELFHPLAGFLYGWTLILVIQTGTIAALGVAVTERFATHLVDLSEQQVKLLAIGVILAFTLFNTLGIKKGARLLDLITSLKLMALVAISAAGLHLVLKGSTGVAAPAAAPNLSNYGIALIAAFWAYDGWNNVTFIAGELRQPRRHLPAALIAGIGTVTAIYLLANFAYYQLLSSSEIGASEFVARDAAERWGGATAVRAITLLVALSALGCLNAMVLAGARVIYAMASDGALPRVLARVNSKTHSPNAALYCQAAWTCLLVWSGRYDQLFTYVVFAAFVFYGLTACSLFRLRRRCTAADSTAFRSPLFPWLPMCYVAFVVAFSINALYTRPWEALAGIAIILTGIPAFYFFKRQSAYASRVINGE